MKPYLAIMVFLWLSAGLTAQEDTYFQQAVDYDIRVALNDQLHQLTGDIRIRYENHSPDTLSEIILHLWPNAYRDQQTAFAKQQLQDGSTTFHFSKKEEKGFMDQLDFKINGNPTTIETWQGQADVGVLHLNQPLVPGESLVMETPFRVQIPASFSRLGHIETAYQITQWYPKPAVYDQAGWHPMPYLDRGEFYAEFASFQVTITLPENYVVGATGTLESPDELDFLQQKIQETETFLNGLDTNWYEIPSPFPASAINQKTIRYSAENVHDFAWFADKRFKVTADTLAFTEDQPVTCLAFFTNEEADLWKQATSYLQRSLLFYSEALGAYPYPQMTAVQSIGSAGGGMEYPMITLIGESASPEELDAVITHEVGHNWLQGILAFNERDHAWMDEGLNTYFEQAYMQRYYGLDPQSPLFPPLLQGDSKYSAAETIFYYQQRLRQYQKMNIKASHLTETNYWLNAYDLPAFAFRHLAAYLGEASFKNLLQGFYRAWQFKHPQPADLEAYFVQNAGKDVQWFFDTYIHQKPHYNYKIQRAQLLEDGLEIGLKQAGEQAPPFLLQIKNATATSSIWIDGFQKDTTFQVALSDFASISIDPYHQNMEYNRKDNYLDDKKLFSKFEKIQLQLLPQLENDRRLPLTILPTAAFNLYDRLMLGATWTNISYLPKRVGFRWSPLYSLGTNQWLGTGLIRTHLYPNNTRERLDFQLRGRRFHFTNVPIDLNFTQFQPRFSWRPNYSLLDTRRQQWHLGANYINQQRTNEQATFAQDHRIRIHYLAYSLENQHPLFASELNLEIRHERLPIENNPTNFTKFMVEWKGRKAYGDGQSIYVRSYLGVLLSGGVSGASSILPNAFRAQAAGWNDYAFEATFLGRSAEQGLASQQIHLAEGAFKLPLIPFSNLGRSNKLLLALNLKADLPFLNAKIPIRPYLDMIYVHQPANSARSFTSVLYNGGLSIDLWQERLSIHFPLLTNRSLRESLQILRAQQNQFSYWQQISFVVQLQDIQRAELIDLW